MFGKPKLITVWLTGSLTALLLSLAYYIDDRVSMLLLALAVPAGFTFALSFAEFVASMYTNHRVRVDGERSETERVKILRALALLTEGQLDALRHSHNLNGVLTGIEEEYITVGGEEIPVVWLRDYTADEHYLVPLREYSEGSRERKWAQKVGNELMIEGYVAPARGKYSAQWVNRDAGVKWLGVE